jgi:hypothetical protein
LRNSSPEEGEIPFIVPKGLAIKYNPSYLRRVRNKKSDMSGCDLCNWDARNDLE